MIFERLGVFFCIRTEKRWGIHLCILDGAKALFLLSTIFLSRFFKASRRAKEKNKWDRRPRNWLGYTKHGV